MTNEICGQAWHQGDNGERPVFQEGEYLTEYLLEGLRVQGITVPDFKQVELAYERATLDRCIGLELKSGLVNVTRGIYCLASLADSTTYEQARSYLAKRDFAECIEIMNERKQKLADIVFLNGKHSITRCRKDEQVKRFRKYTRLPKVRFTEKEVIDDIIGYIAENNFVRAYDTANPLVRSFFPKYLEIDFD